MFRDVEPIIEKKIFLMFAGVVVFFVFAFSALAQQGIDLGDTFNRGRNIIEGRIYYPSGRSADKRFKVTLQSVTVNDAFTFSDDQGVFVFRRLPGGTYRITIDAGKEYETHYETMNVVDQPRRPGDKSEVTWSVTIFLKLKGTSKVPSGTVNAALASVPKPALELYEKAKQAAMKGDAKKAIELLERAVKKHPQFAEAYNEMGALYLSLNDLSKSIEAFHEAIKIVPDDFGYRLNFGYALLQNKKPNEAKVELQKAVSINNKSADALIQLGRAHLVLSEYEDAEKCLNQAVSTSNSDVSLAYKYLGVLYDRKGETEKAIEALEKYLSIAPKAKDVEQVKKVIEDLRRQKN